jgi:hypothetical protein
VEASKLDVEVSEITDGGLLGVNGILDDTAWASMTEWRGLEACCARADDGLSSVVGCVGLSGGCVVEEGATRKFLLEVVELGEVEPNLPLDTTRAGFHANLPLQIFFCT